MAVDKSAQFPGSVASMDACGSAEAANSRRPLGVSSSMNGGGMSDDSCEPNKRLTRAAKKRALITSEVKCGAGEERSEAQTPRGAGPARRKAKTSSSKKLKKGAAQSQVPTPAVSIFQLIDNDDVVLQIFSFFIGEAAADKDACGSLPAVSAYWHNNFNSKMLWGRSVR